MSETGSGSLERDPTADRSIDGAALPGPAELTRFQIDILAVIGAASGESYGLGIKSDLEALYGKPVNHGRLYPNLDELAEYGLVEKGEIDRRTNSYELTDRGVALLDRRARRIGDALGTGFEFLSDDDLVADGGTSTGGL